MNTLESATTISPSGVEEECALFKIDTTSNPFVFSNITSAGNRYTLTIWVKADAACKMVAAGTTIAVTTEWKKHIIKYTAEGTSLIWFFQTAGNYYVYHSQLEPGNVSTGWAPAPEDNGESIETVNQDMQILRESVSQLSVNADGITETVSKTEEVVNTLTGDVESVKQEINEVRTESNQLTIDIQKITDDGVNKVTTSTGFKLNEEGLEISKSTSDISTKITEDGMTINRNGEALLTADHEGVEAKDLHAKTYLIIGGRSRFENYGSDRTGCFWIGEE